MSKYTIEKHGDGYAIYLGRDWQHHGANIGHLTEVTPATIKLIQDALNATLAQPANQSNCGHEEYKSLCQMCMATKQEHESRITSLEIRVAKLEKPMTEHEKQLMAGQRGLLRTASPSKPWVSLTGDEIDEIASESGFGYINVARAIEAALREKNT